MSYRTALSDVLTEVVAPAAETTRTQGRFPRAAVTALGRAGLLGLTVSPECGGGGLGLREAADVVARTARVCPATAAVLQSHYPAVAVIEAYGSPWVRTEIAAGRHLASLALAESEAEGGRRERGRGRPGPGDGGPGGRGARTGARGFGPGAGGDVTRAGADAFGGGAAVPGAAGDGPEAGDGVPGAEDGVPGAGHGVPGAEGDRLGVEICETQLLVPRSVATRSGGVVALRARKERVVAAGEADTYVWSSRPLTAPDGLTLWAVPAHAPDLFVPARPGALGPRGSATSSVFADPVLVPAEAMLGADGGGLDLVLRTVLPWLLELRAAAGTGRPPALDLGDVMLGGPRRPADSLAAS